MGVRDLGHIANHVSNVQLATELTAGFKSNYVACMANLPLKVVRFDGWGGKTPDVTSHAQIHYWTRVRLKRGSKGEWGRVREGAKGGVRQAQDGP